MPVYFQVISSSEDRYLALDILEARNERVPGQRVSDFLALVTHLVSHSLGCISISISTLLINLLSSIFISWRLSSPRYFVPEDRCSSGTHQLENSESSRISGEVRPYPLKMRILSPRLPCISRHLKRHGLIYNAIRNIQFSYKVFWSSSISH